MLLSPCYAPAQTKYVTFGEQFDGRFYSWPGFDDPREARHMTTITRQGVTPPAGDVLIGGCGIVNPGG